MPTKFLMKAALRGAVIWALSCSAFGLPDDIPAGAVPYPKFDWSGYDKSGCDELPAPKPRGSGPTEILWSNDLSEPVTIVWIWNDGSSRTVTTVAPGKGYYTAFFVNHQMAIVSEHQKRCLFAGVIEADDDGKAIRMSDLVRWSTGHGLTAVRSDEEAGEPRALESDVELGNFHALLIANDEYRDLTPLTTPTKDTRSLGRVLETRLGFEVTYLDNATRAQILSTINDYKSSLAVSDNFLLYFAGHGTYDRDSRVGYWQPVDALPDADYSWIETTYISRTLASFKSRNIMVVADSCFSAAVMREAVATSQTDISAPSIQSLVDRKTRVALTSGGLEPVLDSAENGETSVFAAALISELSNSYGILTASEVFSAVRYRVAQHTAELGLAQVPEFSPLYRAGHDGGDFVFSVAAD